LGDFPEGSGYLAVAETRIIVLEVVPIDESIAILHGIWSDWERVRVVDGRVGCVGKLVPGDLGDRRHVAWSTGVVVHILDGLDTVAAASYEVCAASHVS
jgi:hypothetical protein